MFDINNLKKFRKKLGLTQNEFSKESGVSQSMIAKIESGILDPTYSKVKKIEEAVNRLLKVKERKASDFVNKKVIFVRPNDKIKDVIDIMTSKDISQVPVMDESKVIGLISESTIINNSEKNITVKEIMEDSPPTISVQSGEEVIKQLLSIYPIILVEEKGELIGVITKADYMKKILEN